MEITSILMYLLKSTIAFTALYGMYLLLFRRNQHFIVSRFYLLFTIVFASLFPFIKFIKYETIEIPAFDSNKSDIMDISQNLVNTESATSFWSQSNINNIAVYLYLIVSSIILVRLLYMLIRFVLHLFRHSRVEKLFGKRVIVSDCWNQTFSFFGFIVLPEKDFQLKENQLLIQHELVHVRQYHSLDLLLAELFQVLHWFNPFAHFIKKDMREVHEFLADFNVVKDGTSKYAYQQLLLNYLANSVTPRVANSFSAKLLKKRFAMMTTNKTPKSGLIKYTLVIPVIAVLIGLMSFQTEVRYVEKTNQPILKETTNNVSNSQIGTKKDHSEKHAEEKVTVVSPKKNTGDNKEDQEKLIARLKSIVTSNEGTYLKDFLANSGSIPLILKEGVTYRFYLVWSEDNKNLQNEIILTRENKEKKVEEIKPINTFKGKDHSYFDYFCEKTGAYRFGISDFVKDINYAVGLCMLKMDEAYTSKTEVVDQNLVGKQDTSKQSFFVVVEDMPKFDSKDVDAAREYIAKNLQYPKSAKDKGFEGRVFVSFIIETDGSVSNVKIERSLESSLDNEAIRVIKDMPKWTPGYQRGKAVRVQITLPIVFKLEDKK